MNSGRQLRGHPWNGRRSGSPSRRHHRVARPGTTREPTAPCVVHDRRDSGVTKEAGHRPVRPGRCSNEGRVRRPWPFDHRHPGRERWAAAPGAAASGSSIGRTGRARDRPAPKAAARSRPGQGRDLELFSSSAGHVFRVAGAPPLAWPRAIAQTAVWPTGWRLHRKRGAVPEAGRHASLSPVSASPTPSARPGPAVRPRLVAAPAGTRERSRCSPLRNGRGRRPGARSGRQVPGNGGRRLPPVRPLRLSFYPAGTVRGPGCGCPLLVLVCDQDQSVLAGTRRPRGRPGAAGRAGPECPGGPLRSRFLGGHERARRGPNCPSCAGHLLGEGRRPAGRPRPAESAGRPA